MANVLVQTHVMAMDVDALNRVGVYASANVDNGTALVCGVKSTVAGQEHVFSVTPAAAVAKDLWLAYSPEVVTTVDGSLEFKGLDSDPRHFTNLAGKPFDMFKPVAGVDLIQVTKDFFAENYDPDTVTGVPVMLAGLCRGARGMHSSRAFITSSVMRTDLLKASPPWTTR